MKKSVGALVMRMEMNKAKNMERVRRSRMGRTEAGYSSDRVTVWRQTRLWNGDCKDSTATKAHLKDG
jgi:hypothetical protein